jgi:aminopeptidase N
MSRFESWTGRRDAALAVAMLLACSTGTSRASAIVPIHYEISVEPDAQALEFTGRAVIDISVAEVASSVALDAADLDITSVRLDDARVPDAVAIDVSAQTATLRFADPVAPGRHRLAMTYKGRIATTAAGLFAIDYPTPNGPRRMLTTQFEVADARRFAPMWDEPSAKASFVLEVVVPVDQSAYSNMPEASVRTEGAKKRIRFAPTPRMSSYLLHLTVGDLERVARTVAGVDIGVVTRKGAGESGRFALDAAAEILPWYNDYFGTPYPLPKLDMIAVPGDSPFFGAMENWGAIMYFEHALLVDPRYTSESERQYIFDAVAHEMAHQWFGNLVTMKWWDDLWLNEGYATWMSDKVTFALYPRWKSNLQVVATSRERALQLDADAATHPVVQPVPSVEAANQAFDSIAYQKGSAVIRMLEDALGEAKFRDGIRRYIRKYAYGNTVTDQLWAELAAATGRPVAEIAHDFTLQPGVPLVGVSMGRCESGTTRVTLQQGRFETGPPSPQRFTWQIPVRLRAIDSGRTANTELGKDGKPVSVAVPGCGPVVVNEGQAGYFRTLYAPADLSRLRASFSRIADVDRLALLNDAWAFGQAGRLPVISYLELAAAVGDGEPLVLKQVAETLEQIDALFDGSAGQAAWREYARGLLRPDFERVGWVGDPGEPEPVALLRESLIRTLGRLEDPAVITGARERFARSERDPDALPAAIRTSVVNVVARHADSVTWEEIRARAKIAGDPVDKQRLYDALGMSLDTTLASRALDLALSGEPPVTMAADIIASVAIVHPELAFDFAAAHQQPVWDLVGTTARIEFIPSLALTSTDPVMIGKVRDFAQRTTPANARQSAEQVMAKIAFRAGAKARVLATLEPWVRGLEEKKAARGEGGRELVVFALPEGGVRAAPGSDPSVVRRGPVRALAELTALVR